MSDGDHSEDSFKASWGVLLSVCRTAQMIPLEEVKELLETAQKGHGLAPILYPTEYRDGGADNLEDQAAIARAFLEFRKVIDEVNRRGNERKAAQLQRMGASVFKMDFGKLKNSGKT